MGSSGTKGYILCRHILRNLHMHLGLVWFRSIQHIRIFIYTIMKVLSVGEVNRRVKDYFKAHHRVVIERVQLHVSYQPRIQKNLGVIPVFSLRILLFMNR